MWRKAMTAALAVGTLALTACEDTSGSPAPAGAGTPAGKPAPSRPITGDAAPGIDVGAINREVLDFLNQKGDYAGTYPKTTKMRDPLHGGATVAVTKGGKLVLAKGYGWSDKNQSEPMEPTHRSRIGSVSKIPTAIAILQLAEQGKLDLDASVYGDPGPFVDINTPWPPVSKSAWASSQAVLDDPARYWAAIRDGVTEMTEPNFVNSELNKLRGWVSSITVRHLLSHTSGMLRETRATQVDDFYGRWMRDYRGVHTAVLRGVTTDDGGKRVAPFAFAPGTGRVYSNHAYVLLGLIVEQVSDGRLYYGYHDYTIKNVFRRLGLDDVVVNNTHLDDGLDAWPHGDGLDPDTKYRFPSTGAWSATAQDLTRIMCGLDQGSNHLRLLDADTVDVMHDIPFPSASANQPHGWDSRPASYERYKNGKITGGSSVVLKFLPGKFSSAPDEEINVAVAVNNSTVPATTLVRRIAQIVADATVAADYDLFDPEYRCVTEGPTVAITDPNNGTKFEVGEEIMVEAKAHDADGDPLPITWTLPGDITKVTQPGVGGRHALFYDKLPQGKHDIVAMTADSGGHTASTKVTVEITYEPPQVSIVSHADGDTVQAGDDLVLVGQSKTKFFALPDDQVTWTVIRAGTTVGHGGGHQLTVPGDKVVPGSYQVRFIGHDGTTTADAEITVVAEPTSPSAPTATITAPATGTSHSVSGSLGSGAEFSFAGTAVDSDGTVISGTHFRWTATRAGENGPVTTVLCEGSSAGGGPGAGGFATVKNCASFTAELTGHHYGGHTNYTVVLEVTDADGETDTDSVAVKVYTPPAS